MRLRSRVARDPAEPPALIEPRPRSRMYLRSISSPSMSAAQLIRLHPSNLREATAAADAGFRRGKTQVAAARALRAWSQHLRRRHVPDQAWPSADESPLEAASLANTCLRSNANSPPRSRTPPSSTQPCWR